ncbi:MAG: hypothetical protein JO199_01470 [Candidatus Eremiobacteraeota bacterium]|nr:hypothetical protein [Candidatus Eremiobacteraeota bacterium]
MEKSRFGAAVLVAGLAVVDAVFTARYRLLPAWSMYAVGIVMIGLLVANGFTSVPWLRQLERWVVSAGTLAFFLANFVNLLNVIRLLVHNSDGMQPIAVFDSGVAIWFANFLTFTIAYWLTDAGGPDARAGGELQHSDFDFPEWSSERVPEGWRPTMFDYVFISFTTNTAFSPTEAMPISPRGKLFMMLQSSISLITIAVVAARAINTLR